jgi:hypothetical protein
MLRRRRPRTALADRQAAALRVYLSLTGKQRTLARTAELSGVPEGTLKRWASAGNWRDRAAEHDASNPATSGPHIARQGEYSPAVLHQHFLACGEVLFRRVRAGDKSMPFPTLDEIAAG